MEKTVTLNKDYLKELSIEHLMKSPIGDKLEKALSTVERVQTILISLNEKQGEEELTKTKIGTMIALSMIKKVAAGKEPKDFTEDDWKDIANTVIDSAVIMDDQSYSVYVFTLYADYIEYSANLINTASDKTFPMLISISTEIRDKAVQLKNGEISEIQYTEDCLWLSLEGMMKLLATCINYIPMLSEKLGATELEDFAEAVTSFAFEYGRYMLYKRENELLELYIQNQYELDSELKAKLDEFERELNTQAEEFMDLLDNAYSADFRERFVKSAELARHAGVDADQILDCTEKIDDFFM